ncbi:Spo0E family sporulation regulatory protein-aspartic acid phosphatase [Ureibacillus composti]
MVEILTTKELSLLGLEHQFMKLQTRMINLGTKKGLSHPETIQCSQELDRILNTIYQIKFK